MSLPDILPCSTCGKHCADNLKKYPPLCGSKKLLSTWLVNFHNEVNMQTNKENGTNKKKMLYSEAQKKFDGAGCYHTS